MLTELEMQRVYRHQPVTRCAKCGEYESDAWWRRILRRRYQFRRIWCPGGKIVGREGEPVFVCAGVVEEHLHVVCGNCGFTWLMATQDAS